MVVDTLRELARKGVLAATVAAASPAERVRLTGAAYELAAPIVRERLTRRIEWRRGHWGCAGSLRGLRDGCLDRFYDDVESVVDHMLHRATMPIRNLDAWVAGSLRTATVDGHRKRRGQRGAPQRPRLPDWLVGELGHDRWLTSLATDMLDWVGVASTAGTGIWPLEVWAGRRAEITQDWPGSDPATVEREVNRVLAAMRVRPGWYERNVETPLGRKHAPVAPAPLPGSEQTPLLLAGPDAAEDTHLLDLAADALALLNARLAAGDDLRAATVTAVREAFGSGTGEHELDRPPHAAAPYEERVPALLADARTVERIVDTVLSIITE